MAKKSKKKEKIPMDTPVIRDIDQIRETPEAYLQVDMIREHRVVDTFFMPSETDEFVYLGKNYDIDDDSIFLQPFRDQFIPTIVVREKKGTQKFKKINRGITGKALALLYRTKLYQTLLTPADDKYNLFVILLVIIQLSALAFVVYFLISMGRLPGEVPDIPMPINPRPGIIFPWGWF